MPLNLDVDIKTSMDLQVNIKTHQNKIKTNKLDINALKLQMNWLAEVITEKLEFDLLPTIIHATNVRCKSSETNVDFDCALTEHTGNAIHSLLDRGASVG